jgi:hypothetical protein
VEQPTEEEIAELQAQDKERRGGEEAEVRGKKRDASRDSEAESESEAEVVEEEGDVE